MSEKMDECLDKIESIDFIRENASARRCFETLKSRVKDKTYKLAVVGEFSSGKSTFINALIGRDILKHAKNETTATITYVHNVRYGDKRIDTARVNYCDDRSIYLDTLSEIQKYTTVQSEINVAEEILSVDIYVNFLNVDEEIVIVDTPGLNGLADKHREITINEIRKAHACIYIVQLRGITNTDTEFLKILLQFQRTFVFVHNYIDELHASEGETVSNKLEEDKNVVRKCFGNEEYRAYFCGISALMALCGRDEGIKRLYENSAEDINFEQRKQMLKDSGYPELVALLGGIINDKEFRRRREKDNCNVTISFVNEMLEILTGRQESMERVRRADSRNKDVDSLQKIRDNIISGQGRIIGLLNNCISSSFASNRKKLIQDSHDMLKDIYSEMEQSIETVSNYEDFQQMMQFQAVENALDKRIVDFNGKLDEEKQICINFTYKLVLARMDEYECTTEKPCEIVLEFDDIERPDFIAEDDKKKLDQMKRKQNADANEIWRLEEAEKEKENEKNSFCEKVNGLEEKTEQLKIKYEAELKMLKEREPEKVEYNDKKVSRSGFWGRLKDIFKGKQTRKYADDSKHRQWENDVERLKRTYYAEMKKQNEERERLEDIKKKISGEQDKLKADRNKLAREVRTNNKYIEEMESSIKIKEENIKREYLAKLKGKLLGNIRDYLFGENGLENLVKSNIETDMRNNIEPIKEMVAEEYGARVKNRILEIEKMIESSENGLKQTYTDYSQIITQLAEIKIMLEEEMAS